MRRFAAVCVVALVFAPVGAAQPAAFAQESIDPDAVVLTAAVQADGDADWTVAYRVRLDGDNATAAFERYRTDLRANRSEYLARFADRMNRTVRAAENATGREMAVRNVTVATGVQSLPQEYGVVTYRFAWTNFAAGEGDSLRVGDALSGLFLDGESTLRLRWPAGYGRTAVAPAPDAADNRSVTWRGPHDFGPEEPRLVVQRGAGTGAGGGTLALTAGALVLVVLAALAVLLARRRGLLGGARERGGEGQAETGESESAAGSEGPPPELLSNGERVLRLLADNNGRMKQAAVADRLDWTAAKTSQVIGDLREAGKVETFRIGRENVVTLPDVGVAEEIGAGEGDGDGNDR